MRHNIVKTNDGSNTIKLSDCNEHYHSIHGAVNEAIHVYLENGLRFLNLKNISVFEMGFGTGLNTFLTYIYSNDNRCKISYHTIDNEPLSYNFVKRLKYPEQLDKINEENIFNKIHSCEWNIEHILSPSFRIKKIHECIHNYSFKSKFDLVFYDAFSPRIQPKLWEEDILKKVSNQLNSKGVIVTYCAKGEVKRSLKNLGFEVNSLPGPIGKREMIRAILP